MNNSGDLIAMLDAMTIPAGICNGSGQWLAVNQLLASKLPNNKVTGLSQLVANFESWNETARRIHHKRRVELFSDKLAEPFTNCIIHSTRVQLSLCAEPTFLIEMRSNAALMNAFRRISSSQKESLLYKQERIATSQKMRRAVAQSYRDPLTGIANRRAFDTYVSKRWKRAIHEQACLSLLYVDIDYFKDVNDQLGHSRGDEILIAVAMCLDETTRSRADFAGRYGGEEFVILLPDTNSHDASIFAQLILARVRALALAHPTGKTASVVTVSIGCSTVSPTQSDKLCDLIDSADAALYEAKNSGRNCFEVYHPSNETMLAQA